MNANDVDDRIRRALTARADQVTEADLRPAAAPVGASVRELQPRWRWGLPLLAAATVAALAVGTTLVVSSLQADKAPPAGSPSPTVSVPGPSATLSTPAPTRPAPSVSATKPSSSPAASHPLTPVFDLGYQPLWPFLTFAQAEQWRTSGGGSQPWHLDPGQTALSFTQGYLGFSEINRVTSSKLDEQGAHIGVGYNNPNGQGVTSAMLHLLRFGTAANSAWEVVGSDDTDFSLEQPAYGSTVTSPITVAGHITGVDENIHVWVRSISSQSAVGEKCCLPAGGQNSPWSLQVSFSGSGVMTVVASTGGHLQQIERFAIQGVQVR